jgi:2',3'-cyclic-nucleotide 2'-phosphodiesterase (5'-nucleotidase family)
MRKLLFLLLLGGLVSSCKTYHYQPKNHQPQQYVIDSTYTRGDSMLMTTLLPYRDSLEKEVNAVLIQSEAVMVKAQPESALGNLLADILLVEVSRKYEKADIALLNYGGIRAALPKGDVTMGAVMEIMPFMNYVVILTLDGPLLQQLLDHWAAKGGTPVSGVRFVRKEGKATEITVGGKPFDINASYKLATIDYLAEGGDGCDFLKTAEISQRTPELLREIYVTAFRNMQQAGVVLKPMTDERIR